MKTTARKKIDIVKLSNGAEWAVFTTGKGRSTSLVQNSAGESFELSLDRARELSEVLMETGYRVVGSV